MRRLHLLFPVLVAVSAVLFALAPAAVHASDDAAAGATIVFHEDLVIGLDPETPIGRVEDIAVDSAGNIYVLDTGFMTVHKFSPGGTHLGDIGREGEAPGEFFAPNCLTLGPGGDIYVAGASSLITVLHPDGTPGPLIAREQVFRAQQIRFDPSGRLYLVGFDPVSRKVIHRYATATFEYLGSFCNSYAGDRRIDPRLGATYAGGYLDFAPNGGILFAQKMPQEVFLFSSEGKLEATHAARRSETTEPNPKIDGERVFIGAQAQTTALFALEDGSYLVSLAVPPEGDVDSYTFFDIYDADGVRQATRRVAGWMTPKCRDNEGRICVPWAKSISESESVPVIVRYRMEIVEAGTGAK
jgi:hypothetical protein